MLVDGHLRAETTPDSDVPVLVLDIDEAEADLILATLDPLAAMAEADTAQMRGLLDGIAETDGMADLFATLRQEYAPTFEPVPLESQSQLDQKKPTRCPECGHEWRE